MSLLGIDIGGTKTIVAVADDQGNIISQRRIHTPRDQGPGAVLASIESTLRHLLQEFASQPSIRAVGIGCGGPLDHERGIILTAPNLPGWDNLELAAYFEKAFRAPVCLDNDVNLAALGEARRGSGAGVDHMAYLNIGTGIGGGIVTDGRLYRGCGNAGEFGHQIILPDGPPCLCGRRGCLESLCSGTSIARRARECLADNPHSAILDYAEKPEAVTAEHVALAAREGDALASHIWQETVEYLAIGVANIINILNPRLVVIGGGVSRSGDLMFEPLRRAVSERAMKQLLADVTIVPASLGDQAGIIGAVCLAMES